MIAIPRPLGDFFGSTQTVIHECRQCGASTGRRIDVCECCGSAEIARYELDD